MIGDEPKDTNPLQKLRAALHAKAKSAPDFRFYTLYDKLYRGDVLQAAWEQCRANGGAPGVDGQTFADIEEYGVQRWLDELAEDNPGLPDRAPAHLLSGPSVAATQVSDSWARV